MTDAGLLGKASIDWDHLDATDSTDHGSLINLARPRGYHVSAVADEIFEVEDKLTGRCVYFTSDDMVYSSLPLYRSRSSLLGRLAIMPPPRAWDGHWRAFHGRRSAARCT